MKYLKKFENFTGQDLGDRFSDEVTPMNHYEEEEEEKDNFDYRKDFFGNEEEKEEKEQTCPSCNCTDCECGNEMEDGNEARVWGDELVEKKKINKGFQAYLDKQKAKKGGKDEEKSGKKAKPDFLDLDKDGNKKESMKKAAKDAKEDKGGKEDKKPKFGSPEWQKKYGKKK